MTILRSLVFSCLVTLILPSCGEKNVKADPSGSLPADSVIPQEKMALIISDMQIVEAAALNNRNVGLVLKEEQLCYKGILDKYAISAKRYQQNLDYYRHNPEIYVKLYDKVIVILENRKSLLGSRK